jgi:hypothetical protein
MSDYNIIDTGYANKAGTGTQETVLVNSGNDVIIRAPSISYSEGASVDTAMNPGRFIESEINYVGYENAKISISGIINPKEHTSVNTHMKNLNDLKRTKGLKVLYYNNATDAFSGANIISALGSTKSVHGMSYLTINSAISFLVGRVISVNFVHSATSANIQPNSSSANIQPASF